MYSNLFRSPVIVMNFPISPCHVEEQVEEIPVFRFCLIYSLFRSQLDKQKGGSSIVSHSG